MSLHYQNKKKKKENLHCVGWLPTVVSNDSKTDNHDEDDINNNNKNNNNNNNNHANVQLNLRSSNDLPKLFPANGTLFLKAEVNI